MTIVAAVGVSTASIIGIGITIIDIKELIEQKKSNLKNKESSDEECQETTQTIKNVTQ